MCHGHFVYLACQPVPFCYELLEDQTASTIEMTTNYAIMVNNHANVIVLLNWTEKQSKAKTYLFGVCVCVCVCVCV